MRKMLSRISSSSPPDITPIKSPMRCADTVRICSVKTHEGVFGIATVRICTAVARPRLDSEEPINATITNCDAALKRSLLNMSAGRRFPCSCPTTLLAGSMSTHLISPLSNWAMPRHPQPDPLPQVQSLLLSVPESATNQQRELSEVCVSFCRKPPQSLRYPLDDASTS